MKNVRIIPAITKENKELRVAAYCRVSTSGPEQLRSLEIQVRAYKKMIKSHPNWLYDGVYYDIESGLRRSVRKSLDKMLRRAEKGRIVRKIFGLYLQGMSFGQIKFYLEFQGIKTVTGKESWDTKTIQNMLKNEKYKGDTMLQKTFTEDFMTGKKRRNDGQRNKYYVKDSHPAIVSAELFGMVQDEMAKRARLISKEGGTIEISGSKYSGKYLLGNLLVCGDCGASYRRRTERGKVVWRCATRIEKGKEACPHSPTLDEGWVQNVLGDAVCQNGVYDENVVRNEVDKVQIFGTCILISCADGSQDKRPYLND